jgi:peptide/nickel transport system substrate-binding protein
MVAVLAAVVALLLLGNFTGGALSSAAVASHIESITPSSEPIAPLSNGTALTVAPYNDSGGFDPALDPAPDVVEVTGSEPQSLDPALDYETAGAHVIQQVYESLIAYNRESATEFVPLLATDWLIAPDGRTYTFTIRPGVTFHNGAALTAEDVAFTLWRGMLIGGPSSPQLLIDEPLLGYSDVTQLIEPNGSLIGDRETLQQQPAALLHTACLTVTQAVTYNNNSGTVTFHLVQPRGDFMHVLAGPWGAVLDRDWLIAHGGWNGSCDTWQNSYDLQPTDSPIAAMMNGTGPYRLDYWAPGVEVALARNESYWRQLPMWPGGPTGKAALQRPLIKLVSDENQRANMLLSGEADLGAFTVSSVPTFTANVLLAYDGPDGRVATLHYPTGTLRMYQNVLSPVGLDAFFTYDIATDGPRNYVGSGALDGNGVPVDFFNDVHVRKAFSYAFDWTQFIDDVYGGQAVQRRGPFIKGILGYTDTQPTYFYSPTLAMQEFAQAWGGQVLQHGFEITLAYRTGSLQPQRIAEILKTNLEALTSTFHVNVMTLTLSEYQTDVRAWRLPFFWAGWAQDIPHPHNWVVPWFRTTYADRQRLPADQRTIFGAKIDTCITLTGSAAQTCYEDIQNTAYLSATDIFLVQPTTPHFTRGEVRGYFVNGASWFGGPYLYALSKGPLPTIEPVTSATAASIPFTSTGGTTANVAVPVGAVTQTTSIVAIPDVPVQDAPGGFQLGNLTFNLQAYVSGTLVPTPTFQQPITITLHYNEEALGLVNETDLLLLWWDGADWVDAACGPYQRDLIDNILTVPICHFSQFTIGGTVSAGLVVDGTNYNDPGDSFNYMAYQGLLRAGSELSITTQVYTTNGDYQAKLEQCATDGHAVCLGVGFLMADAMANVAASSSTTKFAVVDYSSDQGLSNLRNVAFAEDEAGYLAGVLAGKITTNHKVGVVGGMEIGPVVRFAEGYRNGAQCANGRALVFINYTGTFVDPNLGAQVAQQMMVQGADVIFGAAGPTGNGAILTATQSGRWAIGVDSDQYVTLFNNGSVAGADKLLSSAMKRVDNATYDTIADVISGTFTSGTKTYRVVEDGVGLAPFHGADPSVPQSVRDAIDAAKQGLGAGTIDVHDDCRVYLYLPLVRK